MENVTPIRLIVIKLKDMCDPHLLLNEYKSVNHYE